MTSSLVVTRNRPVHRTHLANGILLLVTENPAADIVAARMFLKAGSRWDKREQAGLSNLVSSVLTKGSAQYSSLEIAEQVESIGASLGTDAAADYFLTSIKTVAGDFPAMLKLAGEVMRHPTFPEHEIELEKRLTLQSIRSRREQPFNVAMENLRQIMHGAHPYGISSLGSEDTVGQLTRDDLLAYHQQFFRPDQLIISISGRIDAQNAEQLVESVFGDWTVDPARPLATDPEIIPTQPSQSIVAQETQQSIVMLGYLAPAVPRQTDDPTELAQDYAALKLINTYLGSGLSSRLFVELREKRGLAYEVSAFYSTHLDPTHFVTYMGTAPENTQTAIDGLKSEVDRLVEQPLSDAELQNAKNKFLGQYALGKQTNAQIAQAFGWYEAVGLGLEFDEQFPAQIEALTAEQLQAAAQRHLSQPYLAVLGPEQVVQQLNF
ncbi:insulinase family protein [filamentous cyanobacterium LEGE 11480]|uniref:Insulinase family protein n=1 Tax=Romeriopsis navalis LEGE 11480 TaxID=2777977 RepID=A0A928Z5M8_9CYAN|nr:pitrilysin family protein [Romeriopsis navalis]MBE9032147.1 insulinase family protein [Romeriopsis navalis LEGE 11480]